MLFIELGRQCNLRCKHCVAGESQIIILSQELDKIAKNIPRLTKQRNKEIMKKIEDAFSYLKWQWNDHIRDDLIKDEKLNYYVQPLDESFIKIENGLQASKNIMNDDSQYLLYLLFG